MASNSHEYWSAVMALGTIPHDWSVSLLLAGCRNDWYLAFYMNGFTPGWLTDSVAAWLHFDATDTQEPVAGRAS